MGGSEDKNGNQSGSASKEMPKAGSTKPAKQDEKEAAERLKKAQKESKIRERVALEARAFDVVNRLIEPSITAEYLLKACHFIDHSHYEDVVEERSISHLCGYPLCNNALGQVAKKKYHISTKSNTVYDITERKKFCSNSCYRASKHLHKQIPQTPVWTRKREDAVCFDLLQHDVKRAMEGEEVIGIKMFGLKEEVSLLEKLDKKEEETSKARKAKSSRCGGMSLKESKRLSDQLLSLTTEEDLEKGIEQLSLSAKVGDSEHCTDEAPGCSSIDPETGRQSQEEPAGNEKCESNTHACRETRQNPTEDIGLECSMKDLTLQGSGDANSVDSDDDCDEDDPGDVGVSKSSEVQNPAFSRTCTGLLCPVGADSDDDDDDDDVQEDTGKTRESISLPKSQVEPVPVGTNSQTKGANANAKSDRDNMDNTQRENALKQQPGESKSAYLMRLLDRRKNMLLKVADIQSDFAGTVQSPKPKLNSSAGRTESEVASEVHKAKSPVSERKERPSEENKHSIDLPENSKQEDRKTLHPEASHFSREKSTPRLSPMLNSSSKMSSSTANDKVSPLGSVCQVISTWVSAETLAYLGLNSAKNESSEGDGNESTDVFHRDPDMQRKYQDLCQRLAGQEKDFDGVLDEEDVDDGNKGRTRKPLPNYEELKKQAEEYQLRVQQFFSGSVTIKPKPTKMKAKADDDGDKTESDRPIVLPVIDSHNQLLIRRHIVLERLDHTMPSLLPPLGLSVQDISASLRELVFTFSLTSQNIVFKPVEWMLVAIILLQMMEKKCAAVSAAFQSPAKSSAFNLVLSHLHHSYSSLGLLVQDMLIQCRQALQEQPHQPSQTQAIQEQPNQLSQIHALQEQAN